MHVTLIPYIKASEELKTKPTQHSVGKLREIGINPDILICRAEKPINPEMKAKLTQALLLAHEDADAQEYFMTSGFPHFEATSIKDYQNISKLLKQR